MLVGENATSKPSYASEELPPYECFCVTNPCLAERKKKKVSANTTPKRSKPTPLRCGVVYFPGLSFRFIGVFSFSGTVDGRKLMFSGVVDEQKIALE